MEIIENLHPTNSLIQDDHTILKMSANMMLQFLYISQLNFIKISTKQNNCIA
jgi:hypothetical protein